MLAQVFDPTTNSFQDIAIPPRCVAVLPGYTLEQATCGIFKAALHQVVGNCFCSHASLLQYQFTAVATEMLV